jgi:hypothetical protein
MPDLEGLRGAGGMSPGRLGTLASAAMLAFLGESLLRLWHFILPGQFLVR